MEVRSWVVVIMVVAVLGGGGAARWIAVASLRCEPRALASGVVAHTSACLIKSATKEMTVPMGIY